MLHIIASANIPLFVTSLYRLTLIVKSKVTLAALSENTRLFKSIVLKLQETKGRLTHRLVAVPRIPKFVV